HNSGLTLIEVMVALVIVGLIFAVSATGLRSVFHADLKSSAGRLASTLRYLSDKAVTEHLYIKIIYDLKRLTYTVEEWTEPVLVSGEEEESEAEAENKAAPQEEVPKKKENDSCVPSESSLLKPINLPSGMMFKGLFLSYLKNKKQRGKASCYFFPDGYA